MTPEQLDRKLETTRPTLSDAEVTALWLRIAEEVATPASVPSPYLAWLRMNYMAPVAVMLIVLLGTTGTVAASQSARPGDLLFPVERAIERAQLFLASAEREAALRSHFANERLLELEDILAETGTLMTDDSFDVATVASTTIRTFSAEADVFTDTTVVEVEINDVKWIFMTTATTREAVVGVIAARYGLTPELVAAALDFEIEDRASRPSERGRLLVDGASEARVSEAIGVLLDELEGLDDTDLRDAILASLVKKINRVEIRDREENRDQNEDRRSDDIRDNEEGEREEEHDSRVRIDDDRIEIHEDEYRIRIDADGEVKVKEYGKSEGGDDEDTWEEESEHDNDRSARDEDDYDRHESRDDNEEEEGRDDDSRGHGRDDDEDGDDRDNEDEEEVEANEDKVEDEEDEEQDDN